MTTAATVQAAVEVNLETRVQHMIVTRCEEHARLDAQIKEWKGRQERLKDEVEELFTAADQGAALMDGTTIAGHKVKLVCGSTRKLDTVALMRAYGLTQAELDAHMVEKASTPYIKITPPRGREGA